MYIVIAIIAFGLLIMIHELGHFSAAKSLGVRVNEFAIGMGPAILKKQGKITKYSLRLFPVGGFCAMEGEDAESSDPGAFGNKPIWKRLIILLAGSAANFLAGFLVVLILAATAPGFNSSILSGFADGFPNQGLDGLMIGDRIVSINGERVSTADEAALFLSRTNAQTLDLVIVRDGSRIALYDFPLVLREYSAPDGSTQLRYGLHFKTETKSLTNVFRYTWYWSINFVRMVRLGLSDLISGSAGIRDVSGPVGVVALINDTAAQAPNTSAALRNIAYLIAFIAVNLSVMNLLPIPALDGGRIFFMLVTSLIEKLTHRKVNQKFEAYIHAVGLVLLLGLMAFVMYSDIAKLI